MLTEPVSTGVRLHQEGSWFHRQVQRGVSVQQTGAWGTAVHCFCQQ